MYKLFDTNMLDSMLEDFNNTKPKTFSIRKTAYVSDSGDVYKAELELAGFSKKEIDIEVLDDVLTVKAKNKRRSQDFQLFLHDLVSTEDISAKLKDGLLELTLPKRAVPKASKVEIK